MNDKSFSVLHSDVCNELMDSWLKGWKTVSIDVWARNIWVTHVNMMCERRNIGVGHVNWCVIKINLEYIIPIKNGKCKRKFNGSPLNTSQQSQQDLQGQQDQQGLQGH